MPRKKTWTKATIVKATVMISGLFFFSWLHATHFDSTEVKMIAEVAALGAIVVKLFPDS
jgi:hypothetical protein